MVRITRVVLPVSLNFVNSLGNRWQIRFVNAVCKQMPYWIVQGVLASALGFLFLYAKLIHRNEIFSFFAAVSNLFGLVLLTGNVTR